MALTDVYISPTGAGDNSGSSVANAVPAIDSNDWSDEIKALDRANKRFIFLGGTYTVGSKLTFTGSAPADNTPHQWVGADSSGNILRPKFDETGLRLDLTDYPKFVNTANTQMVDTEEFTAYKCLSFENTNASYSQGGIVEASTNDTDAQMWFGCSFKAAPANNNAEVMVASGTAMFMCVFESTTKQYDRILDVRANCNIKNCRVIGGGTSSGSGDGDGISTTGYSGVITDTVICNVHGDGFFYNNTNNRQNPSISNCTIINCGVNGLAMATPTSNNSMIIGICDQNIIFNCAGVGMKANAADDRQGGCQIVAMGSNGTDFQNLDSYEDMIDKITITTADFVDYANNDFRIRRDSVLYKFFGDTNFGAVQNEDYEFVSAS